jgi:hypothetical protein
MATTSKGMKLIAAARAGGGGGIVKFQSMHGFKNDPIFASPGVYVLTLKSPPKHREQIVPLVTRHDSSPGTIEANVLGGTPGQIQINNFSIVGGVIQADTQFSIAVFEVPLFP